MATNPLANIFNDGTLFKKPLINPQNHMPGSLNNPLINLRNQTLPNGGGSYNPAGKSAIAPAPIFTGAPTVQQNTATLNYDKYRDPKTGEVMSPEEWAISLGNKVPKGNGEISNYAGNALSNPDQTANQLTTTATNLNNSRNDIATGTTDPYKVGSQSGIAYSPTELKAIEKAYAGIYDPALNDVFSRLKDKQVEDAKAQAREDKIFATNESIRLWKATTGTKGGGSGSGTVDDLFTPTQILKIAQNSGETMAAVKDMNPDVANFFYSNPMGENEDGDKQSMWEMHKEDIESIKNGDLDYLAVIAGIESEETLPEPVRHYLIDQIPNIPMKVKESAWKKIWGVLNPFD
jgi:hypothetical protein